MVSVTALVLGVPLIYASLRMIAAEEFDSAAVGVWFLTQVCTLASGVDHPDGAAHPRSRGDPVFVLWIAARR